MPERFAHVFTFYTNLITSDETKKYAQKQLARNFFRVYNEKGIDMVFVGYRVPSVERFCKKNDIPVRRTNFPGYSLTGDSELDGRNINRRRELIVRKLKRVLRKSRPARKIAFVSMENIYFPESREVFMKRGYTPDFWILGADLEKSEDEEEDN